MTKEQTPGLELQLQKEAQELRSKKTIYDIVGFGMVEALENSYQKWKEKPAPGTRERYLTWRLRFRLRFNSMPDVIERLNEKANVGLFDEEVGPLYDKISL